MLCVLQWRDLECLTLTPHTFERLKQLPELQQIISFTAVEVVKEAAGGSTQAAVVGELLRLHQHHLGGAAPTSMADLMRAAQHSQSYKGLVATCNSDLAGLQHRLSPHMRLALTAEVAAGMLCPG